VQLSRLLCGCFLTFGCKRTRKIAIKSFQELYRRTSYYVESHVLSLLLNVAYRVKFITFSYHVIRYTEDAGNDKCRNAAFVGLNIRLLCFLGQSPLSSSTGLFYSVWTVYATKKRSVSHIFCAASFWEHCTRYTVIRGKFHTKCNVYSLL
jgi:hypothetical protein